MSSFGNRRRLDFERLTDRSLPSTIFLPDALVPPNAETEVEVWALSDPGDPPVRGLNLRAQLGEGIGSGAEPVFTDVSYENTIWSRSEVEIFGGVVDDQPQFVQSAIILLNKNDPSLTADGVISRLTVDTKGILSGSFEVRFSNTPFPDSDFSQIPADTVSGTIDIASAGDSNLDRVFNSTDLIFVLQRGEYEDSVSFNSDWADGDWNGDGDFNSGDFVHAFTFGRYVR